MLAHFFSSFIDCSFFQRFPRARHRLLHAGCLRPRHRPDEAGQRPADGGIQQERIRGTAPLPILADTGKHKGKKPPLRQEPPWSRWAPGGIHLEVTPGFEPGNEGFADPCLTTWLCHRMENRSKGHLLPSSFVERATGLEPATSTLARWRSTR